MLSIFTINYYENYVQQYWQLNATQLLSESALVRVSNEDLHIPTFRKLSTSTSGKPP